MLTLQALSSSLNAVIAREAVWAEERLLGDLRQSVPQNGRVHLHIIEFFFFGVGIVYLWLGRSLLPAGLCLIVSRALSGMFLVSACNRRRKGKRTNRENPRRNREKIPENRESPKKGQNVRNLATTPILKKNSIGVKRPFSEQLSEWHTRPNLCENPILGANLGATLRIGWTPKFQPKFSKHFFDFQTYLGGPRAPE